VSQFSTAGCADWLIALVGDGTSKCVIASDTSRVRVLLLLVKAPFGVLRCLIVVFRFAVVVVGDLDHPSRSVRSSVRHDLAIVFIFFHLVLFER